MKSKTASTLTVLALRVLLWIGVVFYLAEARLHFFGLPILEHNKIFLPTDDRYIAIMAVTYAVLLILISANVKKYQALFAITMMGILAQALNGAYISEEGGYHAFFHTQHLDRDVVLIGYGFLVWYPLTWLAWLQARRAE